jgi:D-alanine-D-alanine ligase
LPFDSTGCMLASNRMKIGLTFDLRSYYLTQGYSEEDTAEFDRDDTIEAIAGALAGLGHQTERIGAVTQLVPKLAAGERWDLVFNIAEGMHGLARESQVPALLDAYRIPYTFSDPVVLGLCLHKGWAKRVIRDQGLPTPDFAVVAGEEDLSGVHLKYPLFAKPVAEGTGKGVDAGSKLASRAELEARCRELLARYRQPVLVERFLPGREYTVGIIGTGAKAEAVGTLEVLLRQGAEREVYSYQNKENCEELVDYRLAKDPKALQAQAAALACWRALGCRDAGRIDLREDERGVPNIMELNPLAGLHPQHSDLPILCGLAGIPFPELIRRIVDSAVERISKNLTR